MCKAGLTLAVVAFLTGVAEEDWSTRLDGVRRAYDLEMVEQLIASMNAAAGIRNSPTEAEALLIKADLLRYKLEQLPEDAGAERAALGDALDEAAKSGIAICDGLPESSEKYRRRADLRGTLIRSRFRAKKHRAQMESDAALALKLDPKNARAYVSRAKPLLFANERQGGDIDEALQLLERALSLDPSLESARLLHAFGLAESDRAEEAVREYQTILRDNSRCVPAARALENLAR